MLQRAPQTFRDVPPSTICQSLPSLLSDAGQAVDRYLRAFERGTMLEDVCGPRPTDLRAEQAQLQTPERELGHLLVTNTPARQTRPCWRCSAATSATG
jgi:hypothetical protein